MLYGSAALRLYLRLPIRLSPLDPRRFATSFRLRSIFFYSPAAGMVSLGWLSTCMADYFFIACSEQGIHLQQVVTNRVGRWAAPPLFLPLIRFGFKTALAFALFNEYLRIIAGRKSPLMPYFQLLSCCSIVSNRAKFN